MTESPTEFERMLSEASDESAAEPKKKGRTLRNILIALGIVIALIGIVVGIGYAMINNTYNKIERVEVFDPKLERPAEVKPEPGKNAPINILLLGSDSRDASDKNAAAEDMRGFRSDAIMVAQISPDRKNVTVMSIMRDNWVEIQGHGQAKINAAVAFGGVPLAVNTIENFIDARIDHVALIDFESFKGLTDAVGGVTVNNKIPFTSHHGNFTFPAGEITLNGEEALGFVRERYAFADGDYQRARNQQEYLKGLLGKLLSKDTLTSPGKVSDAFQALTPYLIVDSGLTLPVAANLGLEMRDIRTDNISFFTSPTLGTGTSGDGQSIVLPDWVEIDSLRAAMRDGTLNEYSANRQVVGAEKPSQ